MSSGWEQAASAPRWLELAVGVLLSILALGFLGLPATAVVLAIVEHPSDRADWHIWAGAALVAVVGFWCARTAWYLLTGRERKHGGLLSTGVIGIFAAGCLAGAVAILIHEPKNLGWLKLLVLGIACLSFAAFRLRARRHDGQAA